MSNAAISFPLFGEDFVLNFPRSIEIFGFKFYWYGIIIALGFILGVAYMLYRRKDFGFTEDNVIDLLLCAVPCGIVGARLYYVLFNLDKYESFADIFKIWEGGLAIYGSIIAGAAAIVVYCMVKKFSLGAALDLSCFAVLIGQTVGRWGNFCNREAYGISENIDTFFLRMGLTTADGVTTYVHPTFLYESVWNVIGLIILHVFSKKYRKYDGQVFALYVGWYGLGRFMIEGLRADSLYLFGTDIRVSQLLALVTCGFAFVFLAKNLHKPHPAEELFVNKVAALAEAAETEVPAPAETDETVEYDDDEELGEDEEWVEDDEDPDEE